MLVIPFDILCYYLSIIKWKRDDAYNNISGHLSLDLASQFVAIGVAIRRDSQSRDFDQTFGVVSPVILTKLQRRLLIKLVRNIQSKCIKNVKAFEDGAWDLGYTMEVNMRDSYVCCLILVNNNHAQKQAYIYEV